MSNIYQLSIQDPTGLPREQIEDILKAILTDEFVQELSPLNNFTGEASVSEDLRNRFLKYLDKFSEVERDIVSLRLWDDYSLEEISTELELPKEVVERYYSESFKKLKRKLFRVFSKQQREYFL